MKIVLLLLSENVLLGQKGITRFIAIFRGMQWMLCSSELECILESFSRSVSSWNDGSRKDSCFTQICVVCNTWVFCWSEFVKTRRSCLGWSNVLPENILYNIRSSSVWRVWWYNSTGDSCLWGRSLNDIMHWATLWFCVESLPNHGC